LSTTVLEVVLEVVLEAVLEVGARAFGHPILVR
jgi:hypothetical protein